MLAHKCVMSQVKNFYCAIILLTISIFGHLPCVASSITSAPSTNEDRIIVHVLDGRTGKPISNEHILIFVTNDPKYPHARIIDEGTDAHGIYIVHDIDFKFIQVAVDWHIPCMNHPSNRVEYSVAEIISTGMSTSNSCGSVKVESSPGNLYVFVRSRHWWELTSEEAPVSDKITIHALDGRTGTPIKNEHLLIFLSNDKNTPEESHIDRTTNIDGDIVLNANEVPFRYMQVWVDWHILCEKDPNQIVYQVSEVTASGILAPNRCGHVNVKLHPGDLYIFARPRHWWEPTSAGDQVRIDKRIIAEFQRLGAPSSTRTYRIVEMGS
jgi:5-hydroxyisourate hydrolase-like protein (transthyretin family)